MSTTNTLLVGAVALAGVLLLTRRGESQDKPLPWLQMPQMPGGGGGGIDLDLGGAMPRLPSFDFSGFQMSSEGEWYYATGDK